ncbi:MAG: glutamine synthetase III [Solobacterium sp.]|nr:glutamine synthetase III [Solobacterium sp.]
MEKPFENFGSMVFNETEMRERLPKPVYSQWKKTVCNESLLDRQTADAIAHAMKRWALEKGATHYTHWFQPMTGGTAEKHDAFIDPDENNEPLTHFSGKNLIKGEPDASSFPSGGLRATFEARGYTYWDVTSPVFIRDNVLCIPTVFVSYNGESLDKKDPLLKSVKAMSHAATRVVNLLGDKDVRSCNASVGLEQEYFLIDRAAFEARRDLKLTGRTLFGAPAPKAQELDDHYFGSIPVRVSAFMKDVNEELWKLGIYSKTEHNEVAPGQFEIAPVFTECNIAVDQNQLMMDVLRKTAEKHGLACLLYEKPFEGINGSGKHNNYSIITDNGQNLFSPGEKPSENVRFLVFVCAFIKAVNTYPELLRMSASCAGNDHRLGANEAPPAIVSIYLGEYIERILTDLVKGKKTDVTKDAREFSPISGLSYIPRDNNDRNRTSPVAFTGNKFEFRMLGSSMSASMTNTVLNSIMAKTLNDIAAELEGIKYLQDVRAKALDICRTILQENNKILFSGDGYSESWIREAERRGLPNIRSSVESYRILDRADTVALLTGLGVYTKTELAARKAIYTEEYIHKIGIEVRTLTKMINEEVLPAMTEELTFYSNAYNAAGNAAPAYIKDRITGISGLIDQVYNGLDHLNKVYASKAKKPMSTETGIELYNEVCPLMDEIRVFINEYESIASDRFYHIPSYEDMLFGL